MPYRLLALDVDGTLLDPAGELRPSVQQAVMAAQQRGVRVVLCTGRRFRTAHPFAQALQLQGPIVVHNGAVVRDLASGQTVYQRYMSAELYHQALVWLRPVSAPMVYLDAFPGDVDILLTGSMEQAHPFQREYLQDNMAHCQFVAQISMQPAYGVVRVGIMADRQSLDALHPVVERAMEGRGYVQVLMNKNYRGYILEVLPVGVSKWHALQQVAAQHGIAPEEIIAVGDDHNDAEMLRHAGLGIAMGNAVEAVKAVADYITGSNAEDGVVQALARFVL